MAFYYKPNGCHLRWTEKMTSALAVETLVKTQQSSRLRALALKVTCILYISDWRKAPVGWLDNEHPQKDYIWNWTLANRNIPNHESINTAEKFLTTSEKNDAPPPEHFKSRLVFKWELKTTGRRYMPFNEFFHRVNGKNASEVKTIGNTRKTLQRKHPSCSSLA